MKAQVIGSAVDTRVFGGLAARERAFWTGQLIHKETGRTYGTGAPNKPFIAAFSMTVAQAMEAGGGSCPLGIILDQSQSHVAQVAEACQQFGQLPRYQGRLRSVEMASRKEVMPLQLADLAAWLWNRYLTKDDLTPEQEFALDRISKKGDGVRLFNAEGLDILRSAEPGLIAAFEANEEVRAATPPSADPPPTTND